MNTNAPTRILVVDDDEVDRRAVQRALSGGYVVWEAGTRDDALRLIAADQPDCVLLDYHMDGANSM
ncbi:MAG TPA: response regulator [Pirellulales bacterium]|nr:response regulator [Pirellulales bacterium]